MNILTGIVIVIFLLFMIRGYRRGLIKSLASLLSLAASVILVSFVTPYVSQFLQEQTPVYTYVMERCQESFTVSDKKEETTQAAQEEAVKDLPVPELIKNLLIRNNTEKTYKELAADSFRDYVPKFMANLIMNMIAFVLTWIIVASFIWLAVMTLDVIANLPVIHGVNQLLGLLLGLVQALMIVWIAFLVITILGNTEIGKQLLYMIQKSMLLSKLYDLNVFLNFLQNVVKI